MKSTDLPGRRALLACMAILATALPAAARAAPEDPWEPANRTFYMVYKVLDAAVFVHLAHAFKTIPAPIRTAVRNIIANLTEPGVATNDLLQGHPDLTVRTLARLAVNTSVGVGGVFDVAAKTGLPHHDNNFADTFGRWGAQPGPYLFIPFVGPTTVRDGLGSGADFLTDPFTWARFYHRWTIIDVRTVWGGLDQRVEAEPQLQAIDNISTDSYATLRSLYLQNRAAVIAAPPGAAPDSGAAPLPALPDFDAPGAAAPPPSTPGPAGGPAPAPPADAPPAAAPAPVADATPALPPPDAPIATARYG